MEIPLGPVGGHARDVPHRSQSLVHTQQGLGNGEQEEAKEQARCDDDTQDKHFSK